MPQAQTVKPSREPLAVLPTWTSEELDAIASDAKSYNFPAIFHRLQKFQHEPSLKLLMSEAFRLSSYNRRSSIMQPCFQGLAEDFKAWCDSKRAA